MVVAGTGREEASPVPHDAMSLTHESLRNIGASFAAGCTAAVVVSPFEVLRTRMQSGQHGRSAIALVGSMARNEGAGSFFRGLNPTLLALVPTTMLFFPTYYGVRDAVLDGPIQGVRGAPLIASVAGACAGGIVNDVVTAPLWLVRTRLQLHPDLDVRGIVRQVVQESGVKGLYRGLAPALAGIIHPIVQMPAYEALKQYMSGGDADTDAEEVPLSTAQILLASSGSKVLGAVVSYPHEVLRTQMQAGLHRGGLLRCVSRIHRREGLAGFYRGLQTTLARGIVSSGVTFVVLEKVRQML